ncbi:MAG: hypothetical protein Q9223_003329 [Gallowayella weberi]
MPHLRELGDLSQFDPRRCLPCSVPHLRLSYVTSFISTGSNVNTNAQLPVDFNEGKEGFIDGSRRAPQENEPNSGPTRLNLLDSILPDYHPSHSPSEDRRQPEPGSVDAMLSNKKHRSRRAHIVVPGSTDDRMKLSWIFANYKKTVHSRPRPSEPSLAHTRPLPLVGNDSDIDLKSRSSEMYDRNLSVHVNPSESEAAMLRLLETVQETANTQSGVLATESLDFLASRGYTLKDFALWDWILLGTTAENAAARLELAMQTAYEANTDLGPVPIFVFNNLLRKNDMSAEALSVFIRQAWPLLDRVSQHNSKIRDPDGTAVPKIPSHVAVDALTTMVVRLLRHSRKVWPAACINIAELWVKHAIWTSKLSFFYNHILHFLALPPNESPYLALRHRQRAQFVLIRKMDTFGPPLNLGLPLVINREGYRSVAQVQLAHRKTDHERTWASLKALSWPPWKEDKLGIDAHIGAEYGISRALYVLHQAAERGYGPSAWERATGILAGRDTDTSPTIQTRSIGIPTSLPSPPRAKRKGLNRTDRGAKRDSVVIWAARIKATRTLQEAWMSFLACKDQGIPMSPQLYQEIIEKVIYDEKRKLCGLDVDAVDSLAHSSQLQLPLPGDGREVAESSASHNQAISTREPLPTLDSLLERMECDRIRPSRRLLALLLTHVRSFDQGVKVLQASPLSTAVKTLLILGQEEDGPTMPTSEAAPLLETLPEWLFAAYISFICRFSEKNMAPSCETSSKTPLRHGEAASVTIEKDEKAARRLLRHAFRLVATRRPFYRPPWNSLLKALSKQTTTVAEYSSSLQQGVLKYNRACSLLDYLDSIKLGIDFTGLGHFCRILKNANASARYVLEHGRYREKIGAQAVLEAGADIAKLRFAQLVRPVNSPSTTTRLSDYIDLPVSINGQPALPRLLRVPHPVHLHLYIRCLGEHEDHNGLIEFMHWLSEFADEIIEEAMEAANGMKMFKRCLAALRAFGCNDGEESVEETRQKYESALYNLRQAIGRKDDWGHWGGWPTDDDVDDYISKGDKYYGRSMDCALSENPKANLVTHGVQTRRGLITTTSSPDRQSHRDTAAKGSISSSNSPSLIKITNIPAPHTGHIRVITLNSPKNKNAISRQLLEELDAEFRGVAEAFGKEDEAWRNKEPNAVLGQGTRVIVIGSEVDGVFCAGADLKERKEMTKEDCVWETTDSLTDRFLRRLRINFTKLEQLPIPSISAISSIALGGGFELGLATTFRVFSPATVVGLPETRLGIVPGAGGAYRLGSMVGTVRALDLVLTGRRVEGEEALRLGLCDRLVGPSLEDIEKSGIKDDKLRQRVLQGAIKMAIDICEGGPATTKSAMAIVKMGDAIAEEREYQQVLATEDRNEALRAFAGKRKPVFKGR